jgi:hypothetical protein
MHPQRHMWGWGQLIDCLLDNLLFLHVRLFTVEPFNFEKMKKTILSIATFGLFTAATLFTFSTSPGGHVHFFKKASAIADNNYFLISALCPDTWKTIAVCGAGGPGCIPSGTCGGTN